MPELSQELILGTKFLRENNFEMNLTNNIVKIAGVEIKLDTNNLWKLSPPGQLLEKIDHLNVMSERIEKLINNYKTTTPELGLITNVELSIELEDDQPINLKLYSFPYQSLNSIKQEIDRLLKLDIIRKSTSKYASPAFPILKKNGKTRLVVDYRRLNAKTIKCAFPFQIYSKN
ncbi:POL4 [Hepatospora eriocheir]|uniref:POL4 n=1 Tax=Hepatospora eriocheir TaxID=1081669 RepID=A0A1X0QHA9_9MICR|nr:POL4 [Hepatospora eriocheir]